MLEHYPSNAYDTPMTDWVSHLRRGISGLAMVGRNLLLPPRCACCDRELHEDGWRLAALRRLPGAPGAGNVARLPALRGRGPGCGFLPERCLALPKYSPEVRCGRHPGQLPRGTSRRGPTHETAIARWACDRHGSDPVPAARGAIAGTSGGHGCPDSHVLASSAWSGDQ